MPTNVLIENYHHDFRGAELRNTKLPLVSEVTSPTPGFIARDDSTGSLAIYIGSSWTVLPTVGGGGGLDPEQVRDLVANFIVAGSDISVTHNDASDTLTIAVSGLTAADVTDLAEYVQDQIGSMVAGGQALTATYNDTTGVTTIDVVVDATATGGLEIAADALRIKALGVTAAMLAGSIPLTKMATQAANTFVANNTAGTAAPVAITGAQAKALLGLVAADISNLAAVVKAYRLDEFAAPTTALNAGGQRITTVANPTTGTDAANRTYVDNAIAALVNSSPATLDTLNELAAALGNDPNFATTISGQIGGLSTRVGTLETAAPGRARAVSGALVGGSTSEVITHNLNTRNVQVTIRNNVAPYDEVRYPNEATSVNTVTVYGVANLPAGYTWLVTATGV